MENASFSICSVMILAGSGAGTAASAVFNIKSDEIREADARPASLIAG
jgi:hypothetical protein